MSKLKDEVFLTVAQLSEKLGTSRSWVYGACEIGLKRNGGFVRLPHFKVGSHLRFDLVEVVRFLRAGDNEGGNR